MAQEIPFMGPRWMLSDPILNLFERDKQCKRSKKGSM